MSRARLLLIDAIDTVGADIGDVRDRAAALGGRRAGVRAIAIAREDAEHGASQDGLTVWCRGRDTAARLRAAAGECERVVIAGGDADAAEWAAAIGAATPIRHWPTTFAPEVGWSARITRPRARPASLFADDGAPAADRIMGGSGVHRERAGRGRLGLWDGDYALVPLPLTGVAGELLLRAFATVAGEWSGLDLVVLADAQPAMARAAEALRVGTRVHFAGAAAREAEWAWWAHASAAVITGESAFAGGFVLRALASSCPLVVAASAGPAAVAGDWLARHGAAPWGAPAAGDLAAALATLIERGERVESALGEGRAIAARHDAAALAARL
ncbi:MAG: hypothetical protein HY076_06600, partial [Candidatus Eisenbacteria bacterium]|nr:hypothetical protein [Candidatus Eisenbacteria bacterium]